MQKSGRSAVREIQQKRIQEETFMKRVLIAVLVLVMVLSMAACGGTETKPADGGNTGDFTINVNIWDSNQQKGLQEIADKWTESSGVKVKIEVVDWDNYWTLLSAGAQGGEMPDVFWTHSNTVQMYMENDLLLKLNDYIEKEKIDMSKYYDGIVKLYTRADGNIYALPKDHDTIALLYNKAIFDQYGVEYPTDNWTWEDMYEAAKKIT
jgi:multiple sugar transport system substrate-binding protein